ncbi:MAG: S-adenosylmethionine decarboxylase [Clostridia bacterium]|nr:S-adenosylmethionine decarboxylase [Clostridia bacterium]
MKAYMNNFNAWIKYEDERNFIEEIEKELVNSGFHVLNKCEHFFEPYGYTGLWLLSESHFAIHSFPEEDKIYVELTSCVDGPFNKFKNYMIKNKVIVIS